MNFHDKLEFLFVKLDLKNLQWTNGLAYYENLKITDVKSLKTLAPALLFLINGSQYKKV
jgi:hypothetical protein